MVQTPVGARCPDCAGLNRLPTYAISPQHYLRAIGAGGGIAIVCGIAWWAVERFSPFLYLNLLLASAVGYAIGEIISLSVNRKRGFSLIVIGSLAMVISYLVTILMPHGFGFNLLDLLAVALGIAAVATRLR